MNKRVFNFSAGPAAMPESVLKQAAEEMLCHGGDGMSVMEMSHRTPMYERIIFGAEADLRKLMDIPENYKVLFLQGGASLQFSMAPLNLFRKSFSCDLINTGAWTQKALTEINKLGKARVIASSEADKFTHIPALDNLDMDPEADFMYIVTNNTIFGTRYTTLPVPPEGVPLVADASSNVLSERIDVSKFGMIFFGAQKNVGPAGLTIVVIREDLLGFCPKDAPSMLNYKIHTDNDSMYNTPPAYAVYMAGLVFKWMLDNGGVDAMQAENERKAAMLYDAIDNSALYRGTVAKEDRSLMNVTYVLANEALGDKFVAQAEAQGLYNLKGHRSVGGIRASIYNAVPLEGVQALCDFMRRFERENA